MSYLEAQTWRCDELSARRSMHFCGQVSSMSAVRLGVVGSGGPFSRASGQAESSSSYHVCASRKRFVGLKTYFREQHAFLWASVQHEAPSGLVLWVWSPFLRAGGQAESFVLLPCFALQESVCLVGNLFFESMTGRIVCLSHVHVFLHCGGTRSTEKLISTGLASGGIITLE